jgi:hypothetical protein
LTVAVLLTVVPDTVEACTVLGRTKTARSIREMMLAISPFTTGPLPEKKLCFMFFLLSLSLIVKMFFWIVSQSLPFLAYIFTF